MNTIHPLRNIERAFTLNGDHSAPLLFSAALHNPANRFDAVERFSSGHPSLVSRFSRGLAAERELYVVRYRLQPLKRLCHIRRDALLQQAFEQLRRYQPSVPRVPRWDVLAAKCLTIIGFRRLKAHAWRQRRYLIFARMVFLTVRRRKLLYAYQCLRLYWWQMKQREDKGVRILERFLTRHALKRLRIRAYIRRKTRRCIWKALALSNRGLLYRGFYSLLWFGRLMDVRKRAIRSRQLHALRMLLRRWRLYDATRRQRFLRSQNFISILHQLIRRRNEASLRRRWLQWRSHCFKMRSITRFFLLLAKYNREVERDWLDWKRRNYFQWWKTWWLSKLTEERAGVELPKSPTPAKFPIKEEWTALPLCNCLRRYCDLAAEPGEKDGPFSISTGQVFGLDGSWHDVNCSYVLHEKPFGVPPVKKSKILTQSFRRTASPDSRPRHPKLATTHRHAFSSEKHTRFRPGDSYFGGFGASDTINDRKATSPLRESGVRREVQKFAALEVEACTRRTHLGYRLQEAARLLQSVNFGHGSLFKQKSHSPRPQKGVERSTFERKSQEFLAIGSRSPQLESWWVDPAPLTDSFSK